MAYYRATIEVDRPIEAVFAYLSDFSTTAEWDPGVTAARRLEDGPIDVGAGFEVKTRFLGREVPLRYRIVQIDPPSRVVLEAETPTLRSVDTITFEKTAAGTRVTYDANLALRGLLYVADFSLHLLFQQIGGRALRGMREALARLPG